jgi:hypothetical protein
VVKLFVALPLVNTVPPVAALYQSITAPGEEALTVTVPEPQRESGVTLELAGTSFTVATTAVRAADTQLVAAIRACA